LQIHRWRVYNWWWETRMDKWTNMDRRSNWWNSQLRSQVLKVHWLQ